MPSCAAQGCSNSWKSGYKMCYFPLKDTQRCAIWIHNVNRTNWIPTKHSTLCQVHFAPEMWEKHRADGSLKLKMNAIPTLFGDTVPKELIINEIENKDQSTKDYVQSETVHIGENSSQNNEHEPMEYENKDQSTEDFVQSETVHIEENSSQNNEHEPMEYEDVNEIINIESSEAENGKSVQSNKVLNSCTNCLQKDKTIEEMRKLLTKIDRLHKHAKEKLLNAKRNIKRLQQRTGSSHILATKIKNMLSDTQLKLLSGEFIKVPKWCNNTIQKALKIRFACGSSGYEEVIRHFPLPSLRTLNRKMQNIQFDSGILNDIFDFLSIKVSSFKNSLDNHCMLVLDEMSITPSHVLDISKNTYLRYCYFTKLFG
ncbi:uncharacterized protein [Temnothorax longispinosus]|uniref:uncharacterized protein n=1 Tax=Temnothorax longispinosus TaxID=300112 RepID=UPI003A991C5E